MSHRLPFLPKLAVLAVALFGLLVVASAAEQARFALMARRADAVVVGYVEKEGSTARSETTQIHGKGLETRLVTDKFRGQAPVFRFTVAGEAVEFSGLVHQVGAPYPIGTQLTVLYDPLFPRNAELEEDAQGWAGVLASAFFGAVVLGGAVLVMIVFGGWSRYFPNFRLR